ncbi:hypothetical protein ARMGADRAFT_1028433 [Armillaria gallica]|uniref:Uncharacterized protein n=1 Tax=Armillaria gallica TaxID=47427 RepID=A0A2H3E9C9_ARMGA|nr:hypothetical protein ARMGADRAFT_1028433 [Armillaria gallica]
MDDDGFDDKRRLQETLCKKRDHMVKKRSTKEQALAAYLPLVGIPWKTSSAQQRSLLPHAGKSLADTQCQWKRNNKKAETSRMRYTHRKQEKDTHLSESFIQYIPDSTGMHQKHANLCKDVIGTCIDSHAASLSWIPHSFKKSQTAPIQDQTEAASKNQVVVLHNYVPILEHDSVKKQTNNLDPQTPTTLGQFVRDITDPMKSAMILDLPVPRDTIPAEFQAQVTRAEIDLVFEKCLNADEDSLDDLCTDVINARMLLLLPRDVVIPSEVLGCTLLDDPQAGTICLTSPSDNAKKEAVAYSNYLRWATAQFKGDWAKKIPCYGQAEAIALKIVDSLGLLKLDDDLLNNLEVFLDLGPWDKPDSSFIMEFPHQNGCSLVAKCDSVYMDFDPPTTAFTGKYSLPHLDRPFVDSFSGSVGTPGFDSFARQTCNINRLDMFGAHGVAPFHVFAVSDAFHSIFRDSQVILVCTPGNQHPHMQQVNTVTIEGCTLVDLSTLYPCLVTVQPLSIHNGETSTVDLFLLLRGLPTYSLDKQGLAMEGKSKYPTIMLKHDRWNHHCVTNVDLSEFVGLCSIMDNHFPIYK